MAFDTVLSCSNCASTIPEGQAKSAGWRFWSDGVGELRAFCVECSTREFSPDAPASSDIVVSPGMRFIDTDFFGPVSAAWRVAPFATAALRLFVAAVVPTFRAAARL